MSLFRNMISAARGEPQAVIAPLPIAPLPDLAQIENRLNALSAPRLAENALPTDYLLGFLDAWDTRPQPSREGGTNGYMHASSLIGLPCTRKSCLMMQNKVTGHERVTGGHRIMWAQGRATEAHIREAVIQSSGGLIVYGVWKCKCGHAEHMGMKPNTDFTCTRCETSLDVYHEPILRDHALRIIGSPDLTLIVNNRALVVEIKSMAPDLFDALLVPSPDHVNQAAMYRSLYERGGMVVHDKIVIVYGRKQFLWGGGKSKKKVYKEFHVDATRLATVNMVQACDQIARTIAQHNAVGTLPERTVCSTSEDKTAVGCCVSHLCFSMR